MCNAVVVLLCRSKCRHSHTHLQRVKNDDVGVSRNVLCIVMSQGMGACRCSGTPHSALSVGRPLVCHMCKQPTTRTTAVPPYGGPETVPCQLRHKDNTHAGCAVPQASQHHQSLPRRSSSPATAIPTLAPTRNGPSARRCCDTQPQTRHHALLARHRGEGPIRIEVGCCRPHTSGPLVATCAAQHVIAAAVLSTPAVLLLRRRLWLLLLLLLLCRPATLAQAATACQSIPSRGPCLRPLLPCCCAAMCSSTPAVGLGARARAAALASAGRLQRGVGTHALEHTSRQLDHPTWHKHWVYVLCTIWGVV